MRRREPIPASLLESEALDLLRELENSGDPEAAHGDADDVLCALLRGLGYAEVADAWGAVPKWYA